VFVSMLGRLTKKRTVNVVRDFRSVSSREYFVPLKESLIGALGRTCWWSQPWNRYGICNESVLDEEDARREVPEVPSAMRHPEHIMPLVVPMSAEYKEWSQGAPQEMLQQFAVALRSNRQREYHQLWGPGDNKGETFNEHLTRVPVREGVAATEYRVLSMF